MSLNALYGSKKSEVGSPKSGVGRWKMECEKLRM